MPVRRFAVPGVITLVAVGLLAVLAYGVSSQGASGSIKGLVARGDFPRAPNYGMRLPLLGAHERESLSQLRGKVVLLNVFASWCPPCQAEAPVLEQAQRLLASRGGTVVGVTYLDNASDDRAFVRQYHLTFPVLRDVSGDFIAPYGISGVPDTFVIDRRGRIEAFRYYQLTKQWVDRTLPRILSQAA